MNKSIFICALAGAMSLAGCNNDDVFDFDVSIDNDVVESITMQHESITYELQGRRVFDQAPGSDRWTEDSLDDPICEDGVPGKSQIVFHNGDLYMQPESFSCAYGPHPVWEVWSYYLTASQISEAPTFFVRYPDFAIDQTNGTIMLEREYAISTLNSKKMMLYIDIGYVRVKDMSEGTYRWYLTYTPMDRIEPDGTNALFFESAHELYGYILEKVHSRFGDTIDRNRWQNYAIFDRPYLDVAGLISQWEAGVFDDPEYWITDPSLYHK